MGRAAVYAAAAATLAVALVLTLLGVGDDPGKLPNWQAFVLGVAELPSFVFCYNLLTGEGIAAMIYPSIHI